MRRREVIFGMIKEGLVMVLLDQFILDRVEFCINLFDIYDEGIGREVGLGGQN